MLSQQQQLPGVPILCGGVISSPARYRAMDWVRVCTVHRPHGQCLNISTPSSTIYSTLRVLSRSLPGSRNGNLLLSGHQDNKLMARLIPVLARSGAASKTKFATSRLPLQLGSAAGCQINLFEPAITMQLSHGRITGSRNRRLGLSTTQRTVCEAAVAV